MYLIDANAFMEANRLYYGFDIAPGFWTWLGDPSHVGQVASIDAVKDEITAGTGDLVDWARARPTSFWLADTDAVLLAWPHGRPTLDGSTARRPSTSSSTPPTSSSSLTPGRPEQPW